MEYVFIINPAAGKTDSTAALRARIEQAGAAMGIAPIVEITQRPGHAREIAARYAVAGKPARLYACGGDGTLNEVVQEVIGQPHLSLGCVPCGSGNDYVRSFGTAEDFRDIQAQLAAEAVSIDAMKTTYGYSDNICAAGLDAQVAYAIPRYRRLPGCGGSLSYTLAIVETLFRRIGHRLRITLDDHTETGEYTLLAVCNGQMYGGGYWAAPQACLDDGLLDVLLVQKVSRPELLGLIGAYKQGKHMLPDGTVHPKFQKYITVFCARRVRIEVLEQRPLIVTLDGECTPCTDRLDLEIVPGQLSALLPRTVLHKPTMPLAARHVAAI